MVFCITQIRAFFKPSEAASVQGFSDDMERQDTIVHAAEDLQRVRHAERAWIPTTSYNPTTSCHTPYQLI